jgi:ribosomal silencing factor RsfS
MTVVATTIVATVLTGGAVVLAAVGFSEQRWVLVAIGALLVVICLCAVGWLTRPRP